MPDAGRPDVRDETTTRTADPDWARLRGYRDDPGRFEEIRLRHDTLLRCFVRKRAASLLGYVEPDDLVDETWFQALLRIRTLGTPGSKVNTARPFRSWLLGLALNVFKKAAYRVSGSAMPQVAALDEADVWEAAHEAERLEAVRACLAELDPRRRRIYHDVYVLGLTQRAVAEKLGCTDANVRKHLARIRERVRKGLLARGFLPEDLAP